MIKISYMDDLEMGTFKKVNFCLILILFLIGNCSCKMLMKNFDHKDFEKPNITIGFLSSFKYGIGKVIAGAIPLAVEDVNR